MFSLIFGPTTFNLESALKDWDASAPDHLVPEFRGKPKRKDDPSAAAWLALVEGACAARKIPRAHWPAVALHFMGKKPRARVGEVEKVMRALHGEGWAWTWANFSAAVKNMGWNIDERKTREIAVERKSAGCGSSSRKHVGRHADRCCGDRASCPAPSLFQAVTGSFFASADPDRVDASSSSVSEKDKDSKEKNPAPAPAPKAAVIPKPPAYSSGSLFALPVLPFLRPAPTPHQLPASISARVPVWLLATMEAVALVVGENPDVLTAVATTLVAAGSVAAGGGPTVAAIGEVVVVVGKAIKTAHERANSRHGGH
ncbi:uncharacterized protein BXZ73DRAFT_49800 [Epithele typhae]|uniref:uncharacterized protein n=1 Tax=Epithele typhae TaxID=378194 RepID=UPI002008BAD7|nr:uncharacterized protein BXZ73DRAFT_49800 [Epithele typhae]KAH9925660.1 hypothetical protein BXZ73DRAFT_49800 [Epithele typhae]